MSNKQKKSSKPSQTGGQLSERQTLPKIPRSVLVLAHPNLIVKRMKIEGILINNQIGLIDLGLRRIDTHIRKICRKLSLHRWNRLNKINISCGFGSDVEAKRMYTQLARFSLQHLIVQHYTPANVTDMGITEVAFHIGRHQSQLQKLKIDMLIAGNKNMTEKGITTLSKEISHNLKGIRHLDLAFSNYSAITDRTIKVLASKIRSGLKNLQHLALSFQSCNDITDQGLRDLAFSIRSSCLHLQHLQLSFYHCINFTDQGLQEVLSAIGPTLKTLSCFELKFDFGSNITDEAVKSLASALALPSNNLRRLALSFKGFCGFTNKCLNELISQITSKLTSLQHLELSFSYCKSIENQGLKELAARIGSSALKLQSLHLDFEKTSITREAKEFAITQLSNFINGKVVID